jgi:hypothetical protein
MVRVSPDIADWVDPAFGQYETPRTMVATTSSPIEIVTLVETAKLNGVDPQARLTEILGRIADHKIYGLDGLMPCRYAQAERNGLSASVVGRLNRTLTGVQPH